MTEEIKNPDTSQNNWDKPFWRSVLSGDNGTGSTSRLSTLISVIIAWLIVLYLVVRDNKIPAELMTLGIFTAMIVTTVYSPAKIASIFKSYFTKK